MSELVFTENRRPTGEIYDVLRNVVTGEEWVVTDEKNLIVDGFYILLAALLKRQSGWSGLTYWENGSGNASWDTTPVSPTTSDTALVTPLEGGRKEIATSDIIWLDASNIESATPTNKIQITVSFGTSESVGWHREFALFGGEATATSNSGTMINSKRHNKFEKTSEQELTRRLRITV
jgi:hypothetical protein